MGKRVVLAKCVSLDCGSLDVTIVETRMTACGSRARRRRCTCCGHLWYTVQPPEEQVESWRLIWTKKGPITLDPPAESPEKGKM